MLKLPKNVWIIAIAFSFAMTGMSLLVFIGGIIGTDLSPTAQLATLPIAALVVGNALMTIPAAMLSQKMGRKNAAYVGFSLSMASVLVCLISLAMHNFYLFAAGGLLIGGGTAFYHQFRFAALESLKDPSDAGPALSLIMLFSIVGALIGPELGSFGKSLIQGAPEYSGSFALFALMITLAMLAFGFFNNPPAPEGQQGHDARPLKQVLIQPGLIVAISASAVGYALMSFLMTSTPISMHIIDGHSLNQAKNVIQAHLVAMFLPSLFSGYFVKIFGPKNIMLAGCVLYLAVIVIALQGQHYVHYWWALTLLGIGWNFLFLSGTTLLPRYYRHAERFRIQAINDFSVFSLQACASLSAAWVLYEFGWHTQLWLCIAPTIAIFMAAVTLIKNNPNHSQLS